MKYLIIKGWLGFGDRLETLKMGIKYALENKLTVYVDWRDTIWSHGEEDFYTYFELINIPQLKSLDEIPEDATIYPEYWKGRLHESLTMQHCIDKKKLNIDIGQEFMTKKFEQDVVVLSNVGFRTLYRDNTFFANVFRVKDRRILDVVRNRFHTFHLDRSVGIHLRGTDRYLTKAQKLKAVQWNVVSAVSSGALSGVPLVVVSDDKDCYDLWKRYFPHSIFASDISLDVNPKQGNHNVSKEELKVSKDALNVASLIDFFTLSLTMRLHSTHSDSRFAKEAGRLHPFARTILGI
jgi:hypothetical protein